MGGLGEPFLIGQGSLNPNDFYLKSTTLNNITLANDNLNMNTNRIINTADPINDQDSATKYYVD